MSGPRVRLAGLVALALAADGFPMPSLPQSRSPVVPPRSERGKLRRKTPKRKKARRAR